MLVYNWIETSDQMLLVESNRTKTKKIKYKLFNVWSGLLCLQVFVHSQKVYILEKIKCMQDTQMLKIMRNYSSYIEHRVFQRLHCTWHYLNQKIHRLSFKIYLHLEQTKKKLQVKNKDEFYRFLKCSHSFSSIIHGIKCIELKVRGSIDFTLLCFWVCNTRSKKFNSETKIKKN